ncbi:MAG: ABC transporter permease subunit, partial [Pseudomonadota bacterium]
MRLINYKVGPALKLALGLAPLIVLIVLYAISSEARLSVNPSDKLLPSFTQIGDAVQRMAFEPSKRTGEYLLWVDTFSSLKRLALGVSIAAFLGLVIGLLTGALPIVSAGVSPLLTVISLIPPLAVLPILFIVLGLGEVAKVALIAIGITPFIARDLQQRTREVPIEQSVKAQTLGANTAQILVRVLLPQVLPKLIDAVRLS